MVIHHNGGGGKDKKRARTKPMRYMNLSLIDVLEHSNRRIRQRHSRRLIRLSHLPKVAYFSDSHLPPLTFKSSRSTLDKHDQPISRRITNVQAQAEAPSYPSRKHLPKLPLPAHFQHHLPIRLQRDASGSVTSAILRQRQEEDGVWVPSCLLP